MRWGRAMTVTKEKRRLTGSKIWWTTDLNCTLFIGTSISITVRMDTDKTELFKNCPIELTGPNIFASSYSIIIFISVRNLFQNFFFSSFNSASPPPIYGPIYTTNIPFLLSYQVDPIKRKYQIWYQFHLWCVQLSSCIAAEG